MSAERQMLSDKQRMDSADLSALFQKYRLSDSEAAADVRRLWWELDTYRWELAGALDRVTEARKERDKLEGLYWRLKMTALPGGKI